MNAITDSEIKGAAQALTTPLGSDVPDLVEKMHKAISTAHAKEYVADLTTDEACAICFYAEVPYQLNMTDRTITFNACGLHKRNGVWTAYSSPNSSEDS